MSHQCFGTRREFLWETGAGFTGIALASLLNQDGLRLNAQSTIPDHTILNNPIAKAKQCIFIFCYGGPSHVDLFDYKPELQKRDGQTIDLEIRVRDVRKSKLLASRRKFKQHGQSGMWVSDAFPHMAQHVDKMAFVKSLYADSFAHGSAMLQMNSGQPLPGSPAIGSWLDYGLGSINENLPNFVVMLDPRGGPISGASNWNSGYMPAKHQGTVFRSQGQPILNLNRQSGISQNRQRKQIDFINRLNTRHQEMHPGYSELEARIKSYELAFQLQSTAPEAIDLSQEATKTKEMYGIYDPKPEHPLSLGPSHFGKQCLIARRLIERGVRFVQLYSGGGHQQQNWDAHHGIEENLQIHTPEIDKPVGALLTDLERRGLLDETLVIWGGEFGRQPVSQDTVGRDHNPQGFTYWFAGAGIKGGTSYGETDEIGHAASVNRRHIRDIHATILHLMGLNHEALTYYYAGLDRKLTGVDKAYVIDEILA